MDMVPSQAADKARATDRIFNDLKEQILSGAARRGSKLPTERELATRYSVSVPTVREAIRGLAVSGFVTVRHGSGAYVSANDDSLVAMALGSVMRLQDVHARDALDLLALFIEHAAASAVAQATTVDLRRLREAAEACADRSDISRSAVAARAFHHALVSAAHNSLLVALSSYLVEVQTEFMMEVASRSPDLWKQATADVEPIRLQLVTAIEARHLKRAVVAARDFGRLVVGALQTLEASAAGRVDLPPLNVLMAAVICRIEKR